MINHALEYHEQGLCVMPIRHNKKPYLHEWAHLQEDRPAIGMIEHWWKQWPDAMIGIITGRISGVCVIDADSAIGYNQVIGRMDAHRKPDVNSPNGWHWYCAYPSRGIGCKPRFLPDVDFKADGGYIIAPPSQNGDGTPYVLKGEIGQGFEIPEKIMELLICPTSCPTPSPTPTMYGWDNVGQGGTTGIGTDGRRDDDMFRLANTLVKGGMPEETIREYLMFFAMRCDRGTEPYTEEEAHAKVDSALKRNDKRIELGMDEVRDWVADETGAITNAKGYVAMGCTTKEEKSKLRKCLKRLADSGVLVRTGQGVYRMREDTVEWLDVVNAKGEPFPVVWPFNVERMVNIPPGSITLLGGQQGAGKTAFLLNTARLNAHGGHNIVYISTETNAQGLKVRLEGFGEENVSVGDLAKGIKFGYHGGGELYDVIDNYQLEDSIVILDYLEVTDAFYLVGEKLAEIFRRMKNGIAIIGLQMHGDRLLGGQFGFHKPDLVMTLKGVTEPAMGTRLTIEKARWWGNPSENPCLKSIDFWTRHGCIVNAQNEWKVRK